MRAATAVRYAAMAALGFVVLCASVPAFVAMAPLTSSTLSAKPRALGAAGRPVWSVAAELPEEDATVQSALPLRSLGVLCFCGTAAVAMATSAKSRRSVISLRGSVALKVGRAARIVAQRLEEACRITEGIEKCISDLEEQNAQIMAEWEAANATCNEIEAERDAAKAELDSLVEKIEYSLTAPLKHSNEMASQLPVMNADVQTGASEQGIKAADAVDQPVDSDRDEFKAKLNELAAKLDTALKRSQERLPPSEGEPTEQAVEVAKEADLMELRMEEAIDEVRYKDSMAAMEAQNAKIMKELEAANANLRSSEAQRDELQTELDQLAKQMNNALLLNLNNPKDMASGLFVPKALPPDDTAEIASGPSVEEADRLDEAVDMSNNVQAAMTELEAQTSAIMEEWEAALADVESNEAERDELKAELEELAERMNSALLGNLNHSKEMASELFVPVDSDPAEEATEATSLPVGDGTTPRQQEHAKVVNAITSDEEELKVQLKAVAMLDTELLDHLNHSKEIVSKCSAQDEDDEPVMPEVDLAADIVARLQQAGSMSADIEAKMAMLEAQSEQILKEYEAATETVAVIEAERDEVKAELASIVEHFDPDIMCHLVHTQEMAEDLSERESVALEASNKFTHTDLSIIGSGARFTAFRNSRKAAKAAKKRGFYPSMWPDTGIFFDP